MEWSKLNYKTQELIANSIGIYYALEQRSKLYRKEQLGSLSLYSGVLRMGEITPIKSKIQIGGFIGTGYPDGYKPSVPKPRIEIRTNNYENVVCRILYKQRILIEQVGELLLLERRLLMPTCSLDNSKLEQQYNYAYRELLKVVRDYYVESLRIQNNGNKTYTPKIDMTIPNLISALHYHNIDPYDSIRNLLISLGITDGLDSCNAMPTSLEEIEKFSTYYEDKYSWDKKEKRIKNIYQVEKPLIMNKSIGKII